MKELLSCTLQSNHNQEIDAEKVCKQRKRYLQLKERYLKLREDHKLLLGEDQVFQNNHLYLMLFGHSDLATRLVTALENSLSGETKCAMETLKTYNEEVEKISESLDVSRLLHSKRLTADSNGSISNHSPFGTLAEYRCWWCFPVGSSPQSNISIDRNYQFRA